MKKIIKLIILLAYLKIRRWIRIPKIFLNKEEKLAREINDQFNNSNRAGKRRMKGFFKRAQSKQWLLRNQRSRRFANPR